MIDYRQARALIKYSLISTFRVSSMQRAGEKRKVNKWLIAWGYLIYIISGAALAGILQMNNIGESLHFSLTILSLYVFLITTINIFVEYGSGFLSPDEQTILSPYPISSETFYFSRLAVLLFYALTVSFLLSIGATVVMVLLKDSYFLPIMTMQAMYFLSALSAALLVVAIFSFLLKKIDHKRISKVFSYAYLFGTLVILSGLLIVPQLLENNTPQSLTFDAAPWLKYTPGYFISAFAATSLNENSLILGLPFVATLGVNILLFFIGSTVLSKSYFEAIGDMRSGAVHLTKTSKPLTDQDWLLTGFLFRTPESRVMWKLFRAQLRNDTKFRLGVISLIPITAIYFVIMLVNGQISDPFVESNWRTVLDGTMLYMLILLSPLLLMQMVSQSEAHKASWLFFSTPVDRSRLLLSMRNIVMFNLFLPYLLLLGITFVYFMPWEHALMHTLMLGIMAVLIFEVYLLISPKLPFSEQRRQQRSAWIQIVYMIFIALIPGVFLTIIVSLAYSDTTKFWLYAVLLAIVSAASHVIVRKRLSAKLEAQEYSG